MKTRPIQNNNTNKQPVFRGLPTGKISGKISEFFLNGGVGEGNSIAIDILGKAVLVPLVIIFNPLSKQPKEDKKYSAIKNPIAAGIQLGLEVPIFYYTSRMVRNLANKGLLDKAGSNFSYNAKAAKDIFIESFDKMLESSPGGLKESARGTLEMLKKKKLGQKTIGDLNKIIFSSKSHLKEQTKNALDNFNNINKRLFLLESRFSLIAALLAIPLMCAIENWVHPKVMKLIDKHKKVLDED